MATLEIRKKSLKTWVHISSDGSNFILSKFSCKTDANVFKIVEESGSNRREYSYTNITVYDDTNIGTPETFASSQALMLRLEALKYTGFNRDGDIPTSYIESVVAGTNVTIDNTDPLNPIISSTGGGGGGLQTLQDVTDLGNTTTNDIQLINDANAIFGTGGGIILDNGSKLKEGTIDATHGGSKGIAQICAVGYELKWEAGRQYVMNDGGTTIREAAFNFNNTPSIFDDINKGFIVGSRWILDNGDLYICTDNTIDTAVWELQMIGTQDLQNVTDNGATTTNTIIVGNIATNFSQISSTDIGTENATTGTYAFLGNSGELGLNNGSFESNLKNTNVTDDAVILEFPNKSTGNYIIATTEDIPTNTSDLTNDSDFVSDASYIHTDNNFTSTLKTKLDGIADDAEVNVNADWNATSGDAQILNKPTIPSISGLELQANKQNSLTTDGTGIKYPTVDAVNAGILNINTNAIDRVTVKLSVATNKGQAVYISDANGTNIIVSKASNTSEPTSSKTIGLLETTGSINAIVNVVTDGLLAGLNTSSATIGDPVWLGTNGDLIYGLASKPYAPAHLVYIGVVTRVSATVGEILIKVQNGFELREIHDVDLISTSPTDRNLLAYESSTSLWKNKTIGSVIGGLSSQYLRGDGTVATFPTSTGGGSSVAYYLNGGTSQGTFGGSTYYEINKNATIGSGVNFTLTNTTGYIAQFITDIADPNSLSIPQGAWNFSFYFSSSALNSSGSFYVELYKYNGTTFTLIGDSSASPELITNGTAIDLYNTSVAVPLTTLTISDRLAVRVFVNTNGNKTITLHTQDSHLGEIITTFSTGLNALNGLTNQVQYFTTGTTGTDLNISSATDTHTFNLPTASAANRGALNSTDWNTFNNKQNALGFTPVTNARTISTTSPLSGGGDLTANRTLSIAQSSSSVNGYLSSTDWSTFNGKQNALGFTAENSANKSTSVVTDQASITKYPTVKSVYDWAVGVFTTTSAVATQITTALSGYATESWVTSQGYITNVITALGFTPVTNARTISTTSPLTGGGDLTANRTLSIAQSNTTTNGYLSSSDWNTFNSKGNGTVTSVAALTLGTSGTDIGSTVATGTSTPIITLNVPTASASNRGALSSADWSTFNGKVAPTRTISTTSPLGGGGDLSANRTLTIAQSNTTTDGYLSSVDWNIFNGKQAALVSATNIKTINGSSVLGSGDLTVSSTTIIPYAAYLNTVSGNDSTAVLGDSTKPYLTMSALITALPATYDLAWTIYISGATLGITMPTMPPRDLIFNADARYIYDFNFNTGSGYLIATATKFFTYTFLNGNINLKSDAVAGRSLGTASQLTSWLIIKGFVNIIDWSNEGVASVGVILLNSELIVNEIIKRTTGFSVFIGNPISLRIKKVTFIGFYNGILRSSSTYLSSLVTIDLVSCTATTSVELMAAVAPVNLNLELKYIDVIGSFTVSYPPTRLFLNDLVCGASVTTMNIDATLLTGRVISTTPVIPVKINSKLLQNLECYITGSNNNWGSTLTIDNCRLTVNDFITKNAIASTKVVAFRGNNIIRQVSTTTPIIVALNSTVPFTLDVEGTLNIPTASSLIDQYGAVNYITNAVPSYIGTASALQSLNFLT